MTSTPVEEYVNKYLRYVDIFSSISDKFKSQLNNSMLNNLIKMKHADDPMENYNVDEGISKFKNIVKEEENLFQIAADEILEKVRFL